VSTKQALEQTIDRVNLFLTDGSKEKWGEVAHRREDPLPLFQISELYRWLLEISSGRPTQSLSDSEAGAGSSEPSSPDGSPSTEETSTQ
jgi:hypothetical protein